MKLKSLDYKELYKFMSWALTFIPLPASTIGYIGDSGFLFFTSINWRNNNTDNGCVAIAIYIARNETSE